VPSYFAATRSRYHRRIVSSVASDAISASRFRPSGLPFSASNRRSASVNRRRLGVLATSRIGEKFRGMALPWAPMLQAVLMLIAAVADVFRPRWSLLAEIALLRHQLTVLQRSVARPRVTRLDRIAFVALAAVTPTWRTVLRIVEPETLLRWHRAGFKALWRWRSRTRPASRLVPETVALVRSMASANRLWGAERIRGELLKLGVKVSKRTIQRYMRAARPRTPQGQRWSTFLRNQAPEIWACDFLQAYDAFFRPIFALVSIEVASRKVALAATTRFPSQAWVTQQLSNATSLSAALLATSPSRRNSAGSSAGNLTRAPSGQISEARLGPLCRVRRGPVFARKFRASQLPRVSPVRGDRRSGRPEAHGERLLVSCPGGERQRGGRGGRH
jgi:hypothetical protein